MFQSHAFKIESTSIKVWGRGMEGNGYMIGEGVWESFTSGEVEGVIPSL